MSNLKIYGIKNCDTMKKAMRWLEANDTGFEFHDYKKSGADEAVLKQAIQSHGWESVINRRGTTWRKLDEQVKNTMNDEMALKTAMDNPSIIKRPLTLFNNKIYLGFSDKEFEDIFR